MLQEKQRKKEPGTELSEIAKRIKIRIPARSPRVTRGRVCHISEQLEYSIRKKKAQSTIRNHTDTDEKGRGEQSPLRLDKDIISRTGWEKAREEEMPYIRTTCRAGLTKEYEFYYSYRFDQKGGVGKRKRTGLQKHRGR